MERFLNGVIAIVKPLLYCSSYIFRAETCREAELAIGSIVKNPFTRIASVIFGVLAMVHLLRVVFGVSVIIGGFALPLWVSILGFLIPCGFSIMLWREAGR